LKHLWRRLLAGVIGLGASAGWALPVAADPGQGAVAVFSDTGPDATAYGAEPGYPVARPLKRQQNMVGNYSHLEQLFATHVIAAGTAPSLFQRAPQELAVSYSFQGQTYTISDYLARNPTTGLMVARDNTILFEHYQYARTDRDRFMSQSMAKTVTGMLVGVAVGEGSIRSIDDSAQTYVPSLAGTEMGQTPIRALLHMASGIAFTQNYGGTDDDAKFSRALFAPNGAGPVAALAAFNTRAAPPDTLWNYANIDPETLGLVVTHATGMSLADYLQTRIWQKIGAEHDAVWAVDSTGQEAAFCCIGATLRDYARFGLLLAHDGAWNGEQLIPRQWLLDATEPVEPGSIRAIDKSPHPWGYGYQVWLMPGPRRSFVLEGIEGQRLFVDPESRLVLVHTAVRPKPDHNPGDIELIALWRSVLRQFANP
jgi:CubicO group peptidase (beta-lactamase class C family)